MSGKRNRESRCLWLAREAGPGFFAVMTRYHPTTGRLERRGPIEQASGEVRAFESRPDFGGIDFPLIAMSSSWYRSTSIPPSPTRFALQEWSLGSNCGNNVPSASLHVTSEWRSKPRALQGAVLGPQNHPAPRHISLTLGFVIVPHSPQPPPMLLPHYGCELSGNTTPKESQAREAWNSTISYSATECR